MTVNAQEGPTPSPGWFAKLGTLSILYIAVFLTRIGFGVILVLFPIYLPIPKTQSAFSGAVIAIYPLVEGVSALPVGAYVDRKGRRKVFVAGLGLIAILTLIIGLSNNLVLVGGAHGLEGLAAAMVTVASLTMITDLTVVTNSIHGNLTCSGNSPAPQVGDSEGLPNVVTGQKIGQCAAV